MAQNIINIYRLWEGVHIFDLAYWLDYYYFILFGWFSLFLDFLTSLIKLTLLTKVFPQTKSRQSTWEGKDRRVLLCFTCGSALGERAWWKEVLQLIPESPHTTVSFSFVGLGTHTGSSKTGFDKRLIHSLSNIFLMCFIVVKVTAYYFYHV